MKAEQIVLLFYCAINIAQYAIVSTTGIYISDALGAPVLASEVEQLAVLGACLLACLFGYGFYRFAIARRVDPHFSHDNRIRKALIVGLIATFLGFFFFDYGKAETQSTLPFGFVFRLIPTDLLFAFYFCTVPLNRAKPYILVAAYLALKVSMGWTGMFAGVFWTLFIRIINANQHRKWITAAGITVLALAFLLGPVVYSVKFYLRWGTYEFAYIEALTRLVGRMGFYSNGLYLWENASRFAHEAAAGLPPFSYAKDALVAVLPRSLLGLQGENMETLFVSYVSGAFVPGITFYLGLVGKAIAYAFISPLEMPLMLITTLILLAAIIQFSQAIIGARANPLIFMGVFQVLLSGSIEEISYGVYATFMIYLICTTQLSRRRSNSQPAATPRAASA